MTFLLLKVPINGYKFPVYTTQFCPQNKTEWLQRSRDLNCTDRNGYICVPNEKFTLLMEFCYVKDTVAVPKGKKYISLMGYNFK